jgi:hypothetical protein
MHLHAFGCLIQPASPRRLLLRVIRTRVREVLDTQFPSCLTYQTKHCELTHTHTHTHAHVFLVLFFSNTTPRVYARFHALVYVHDIPEKR